MGLSDGLFRKWKEKRRIFDKMARAKVLDFTAVTRPIRLSGVCCRSGKAHSDCGIGSNGTQAAEQMRLCLSRPNKKALIGAAKCIYS